MIRKADLDAKLTDREKSMVDTIEQKIDTWLRERYEGAPFRVELEGTPNARVQAALRKNYAAGGWQLKFDSHDDQRDGSSHWVVLS